MTRVYLLDPDQPGVAWAPFGTTRPLGELRAGGWTIAERWGHALDARIAGFIAPHAMGPRSPGYTALATANSVKGPCWVAESTFCPQTPMRTAGDAKRLLHDGRAVAWRLDSGEIWRGRHDDGDGLVVEGLRLQGAWQLLAALESYLFGDTLAALEGGTDPLPAGTIVLGNEGAIALRGAEIEPGVLFDVRKGAVILERGVEVRSGTRLEGPCWIREDTKILGGVLRHVSAGPHCRLHGEISTSVFQGYVNKSHDGFVGHSVVGEWVNLGAGTTTSNLKNTYGPVRLDVGAARIDTGRINVGALIGDHVKTAIGTLFSTGTVVGTGANIFGERRSPKYITPFAWGDGDTRLSLPAFLAVAHRVMPRRGVEVDGVMEQVLTSLYRRLTPAG